MARADFRIEPIGPRPSVLTLGGITFTSKHPVEVAPGTAAFASERGLGSSPLEALAMKIRWDVPALAVIFRLELHDDAIIEVFDELGASIARRSIHPVPPLAWRDEVIIATGSTGASHATLEGGGAEAKLSMLITT